MKLPNPDQAVVDLAKLRDYALDPVHKEGKHKAHVFASTLGLSRNDAGWLRDQLLLAAKNSDCSLGRKTDPGQRYVIDFDVTIRGQTARLRSAWIALPQSRIPVSDACVGPALSCKLARDVDDALLLEAREVCLRLYWLARGDTSAEFSTTSI